MHRCATQHTYVGEPCSTRVHDCTGMTPHTLPPAHSTNTDLQAAAALTEILLTRSQYKFNCNKFEAQRSMTKILYGYFRLCVFLLSQNSLYVSMHKIAMSGLAKLLSPQGEMWITPLLLGVLHMTHICPALNSVPGQKSKTQHVACVAKGIGSRCHSRCMR